MKKFSIFDKTMDHRAGFTLVELIVVMSIIGILAGLLVANFVEVAARGRDGQRKSDLQQMRTALELYRADNSTYPDTTSFPSCNSPFTHPTNPTVIYMEKIPCDPKNGSSGFSYAYSRTNPLRYEITTCLENSQDQVSSTVFADSTCSPSGKRLRVLNP